MTFGFFVGSRNFIRLSSGFLRSFCFTRVGLYPLCCRLLCHHGISMIVPRFTFFTDNFVICSNQVTKKFRSGYDFTSTSSARRPCYFRLQADITIWVPRKVFVHCVYPNPVPLSVAGSLEIHEMTWKCLDFLAQGFAKALLKYFHQPNFP